MSSISSALEGHIIVMLVLFVVKLLLCLIELHPMEMYGDMEV
jgi:hypothetical protein